MSAIDGDTLRLFAYALDIDETVIAPPTKSALRAAQVAIARSYFLEDWSVGAVEELRECFDLGAAAVPLFWLLDGISKHPKMTINYAAFELLKNGRLEGWFESLDSYTRHFEMDGITFQEPSGLERVLIPLVRGNKFLKSLMVYGDRPCGRRDHLWLDWKVRLQLTRAKIRDKWNRMSETERMRISPSCAESITDGEQGCDIVKKGQAKAERELESAGISIDQAFSSEQQP